MISTLAHVTVGAVNNPLQVSDMLGTDEQIIKRYLKFFSRNRGCYTASLKTAAWPANSLTQGIYTMETI